MTGSRAPTIDRSPHAERARKAKALDLEHFAFTRGYKAADVAREEVREVLLADLAEHRGKRRDQVHASLDCWREVWRLLKDREQLR